MFESLLIPSVTIIVPPGNYKEFRLFIVDINGASYAQFAEIEMFDAGNVNRLRQGGVTATASSTYTGDANGPEKTIDGNRDTKWVSVFGQQNNSWVAFALKETMHPVRFTLQTINGTSESDRMPKNFRLEVKNNQGNWEVLHTAANQTNWGAYEKRSYDIVY